MARRFTGVGARSRAGIPNEFVYKTMTPLLHVTQANDSAVQSCGTPEDREGTKARRLTILFGTESGNADEVARMVARRATAGDLNPLVVGMADYSLDRLAH